MINKIQIEGYKSIKDLNLDLKPINVLIGANGVGKSNFISFFKLVSNIYQRRLENYSLTKSSENLLHFGSKSTQFIEGTLNFNNTNQYSFLLQPTSNQSLIINFDEVGFNSEKGSEFRYKNQWFNTRISNNSKESKLKDSNSKVANYVKSYLDSFMIYHFHDTSENSHLRTPSDINDNLVLREDGANLPSFLFYLQQQHIKHFKRIEQTIRSIAPYFERFELQPDRLNTQRINLEWREIGHPDILFNSNHLSDGTLRFIALVTLLLQPNLPEVIIIDEPELGLHPVAINTLCGLITKMSKKCQMIISTQSVNLVGNFEPENIVTVDRVEYKSVFNRLDPENLSEWLNDFSLGELWLKNYIKGQPF